MVTAIVIPIIVLYFYWLTKKEMKEHDKKWLACGNVQQEAVLIGEIISLTEEKQRFYYHRYIFVQTLKLKTAAKLITAKKVTPITKNMKIEPFNVGEVIRLYGSWEGTKFFFNGYVGEKS
ncbi:hypothetical protein BACCIP111895_00523 [Neobacillus rhizosphaerae]|uniref:DUF4131 domain-containing protein n=1 Tax=Neobacillus rhizosphaerae TaxID=2880965 RepID=A0ABM9EMQ8_9BACI|nr:hypothetical protein [Neobacillus rhizosphaerae]CAH2713388.1 hypothetical protein BACCIP111895_00523 [Neobacillus rhizosphaerae]